MRVSSIAGFGLFFVAVACALGQEAAQPAAPAPAAAPAVAVVAAAPAVAADAKARVYVYRYKQYAGSGIRPSIFCDEKDIARIQNGHGVVMGLTPGKHTFRSNDKQSQIEVDLKPGQECYIRLEIAVGMWKGHGRLTMIMPEQGIGEFKQMKPADPGMIKDGSLLLPASYK
jgi:hypothetical protein